MRPFVLIWKHGVSGTAINSGITDKHDYGYYGIGGLIGGGGGGGDTLAATTKSFNREKPCVGPGSYWNEVFKWLKD